MSSLVRTIDISEVAGWAACKDIGFLRQRPEPEDYAEYLAGEIDLDRTWGAVDGDRVVGNFLGLLK